MNNKIYKIRAHHGMCLYFYKGKGYSEEFTKNMTFIKENLEEKDPLIQIIAEVDDICKKCPNNLKNICKSDKKVLNYDKEVLKRCNLCVNTIIPYSEFEKLVMDNILALGKREEVCGKCQWSSICKIKK